jgi:hypothetical protein
MSNQITNTRESIETAKAKLQTLEELELLESEYALITNEYLQRRQHLEDRLTRLAI